MKEKQFDHIENKIKEAAEQHVFEFDEKNWDNMVQLLDKDKDPRRPAFWYIIFTLVCALTAGYFLFNNIHTSIKSIATNEKQIQKFISKEKLINASKDKLLQIADKTNNKSLMTAKIDKNTMQGVKVPNTNFSALAKKSMSAISIKQHTLSENIKKEVVKTKRVSDEISSKLKTIITAGSASNDDVINTSDENTLALLSDTLTKDVLKVQVNPIIKNTSDKKEIIENKISNAQENKSKRSSSRLYFIALAGADAGSTKIFSLNNSKVVAKYNISVGYQFGKKISVQTGINISKKIYIAGPQDYTPKAGSYLANVNIKEVEANCLVYEIPLAVRYNVLQRKNTTYYASAGLSSYIMKKEDYKYHYIAGGTYYQSEWAYKGNKNFFSLGTLSLGVEKKLTNKFSLLAEPSLSIPLSGVGEGSVKLYSMAMQVGIKYQPLKKKK
jgi:hypothetical protein